MQNFEFQLPTKVVFGRDTVPRIGEEIGGTCKTVLLVSGGGSVKRNGIYDTVVASLRDAGIEWVDLEGISSNPRLSEIRNGVRLAVDNRVDGILGVGGGSVIDSAKAIAAGAAGDVDVWEYVTGAPVEAALPVFCVLTLAATGTEMNGIGVMTNDETAEKWPIKSPLVCPRVSILDPTATFSVPPDYTAYGGVDAFSHVIEGYLVWPDPCTPFQDRLAEGCAKTIIEATTACIEKPDDYEARATMMWAAAVGWCGLIPAGAGAARLPNHMIEHSLSALHDVPHGAGLSAVIPGWARHTIDAGNTGRLAQLARNVFGVDDGDDRGAALAGITAFEAWCTEIGSPTRIRGLDIPESSLSAIAENAANTAVAWNMAEAYTRPVIDQILKRCY